jgi:hypothetical protein
MESNSINAVNANPGGFGLEMQGRVAAQFAKKYGLILAAVLSEPGTQRPITDILLNKD